jgi:transcription elongation factor GreA
MQTRQTTRCATCELHVDWPPVEQAGRDYCCAGCAAGGPCYCSYDDHQRMEDTMATLNPVGLDTTATAGGLPMTREVFHRLQTEVERLEDSLPALPTALFVDSDPEDGAIAVVPAAWELHLGAQRLATLRRVLARARVVTRDGTAVLGSRVVIRDDDGERDTYTLVAPGEANARAGSISAESPLGQALLGRRAGDAAEVAAPGGTRWITVERVD